MGEGWQSEEAFNAPSLAQGCVPGEKSETNPTLGSQAPPSFGPTGFSFRCGKCMAPFLHPSRGVGCLRIQLSG